MRTIAKNTVWRGLEMLFSLAAAIATSIAVARHFGPHALGYYSYMVWLTNATGVAGTLGLPLATRKYMAEFLGAGHRGLARSVFESTLRVQMIVSGVLSAAGLVLVFTISDRSYVWVSACLVLSILPRTLACIPSQANVAAEDMMSNVPGALAGGLTQFLAVVLTLTMNWGLLGIAVGMNLGYWVELAFKMRSASRSVRTCDPVPLPGELRRRLYAFSGQSLALLMLNLIVWDRSDVLFLKALNADIRQVTFFAIAFNVIEKLLTLPQVLGDAVGATVMAQFGRDRTRVSPMVSTAIKYLLLCSIPLFVGVACLSGPAVRVLYGSPYAPVIPVLAVLALFAIPKALLPTAQNLLQASDKQMVLVWLGCACAAMNILLDVLLVRTHGALGAAFANGAAQTAALVGTCLYARWRFQLRLQIASAGRIALCGCVMGAVAMGVTRVFPPRIGVLAAMAIGAAVFTAMVRWTAAFEERDAERVRQLQRGMPAGIRSATDRVLRLLIRRESAVPLV
jgi:O-antigen/teichoic acid export membrane protein